MEDTLKGKKIEKHWRLEKPNIILDNDDGLYFIPLLNDILFDLMPKTKLLKDYFEKVGYLCAKLGMYVPWTLPHKGATVYNGYYKASSITLKPIGYKNKKVSWNDFSKKIYYVTKMTHYLMPNLIHSLDATALSLLFRELISNSKLDNPNLIHMDRNTSRVHIFDSINVKNLAINLYTIHDCFATTADKVPALLEAIKSVYILLYTTDSYIVNFHSNLKYCIIQNFGTDMFTDKSYKQVNIYNKEAVITETIDFPSIDDIIPPYPTKAYKSYEESQRKDLGISIRQSKYLIKI